MVIILKFCYNNHIVLKYKKTNNEYEIDDRELLVICDEILSWLKLEYKRILWIQQGKIVKLKPLQLNLNYSWCVSFLDLINKEELFSKYFEVISNKLYLSSTLDEKTKNMLREEAFNKYNPKHII